MVTVDWMDSFTPCCASHPRPSPVGTFVRALGRWMALCLLLWAAALYVPVRADEVDESQPRVSVERQSDGLYLTARLPLTLPTGLQEALERGVPLHFIWQAEVLAPRWYWRDRRVSTATRTMRLAYQPLTRRWRVSVAEGDDPGTGNALHRNVDNLAEALALVTRVVAWPVAGETDLAGAGDLRLGVRFGLAQELLPRPLQLGVGGPMDRGLAFEQVLSVPNNAERAP